MPYPLTPVQEQIFAYFPVDTHPYRLLERDVDRRVGPDTAVLDIGCGRSAPELVRFIGRARALHGVDLVSFTVDHPDLQLHNCSAIEMNDISDDSIDIAYSRAVMEHIEDPERTLNEIWRVLKPGGVYVFLTPSIYDYASLGAAVVPNSLHPKIVKWMTGRNEEDVFPTFFRFNSKKTIIKVSNQSGFEVESFKYMGQYPAYLSFNRVLFWFGSMYELFIEKFDWLSPLRGWIYCTLRKPAKKAD